MTTPATEAIDPKAEQRSLQASHAAKARYVRAEAAKFDWEKAPLAKAVRDTDCRQTSQISGRAQR